MRKSRDTETALQALLAEAGYSASAHEIPTSLGSTLPHVHVERTGGYEQDMVIEANYIDFDVYAADTADAIEQASELCGWIRDLAGDYCYRSDISTLPYSNPDPRHPNIARVTIKAQILVRTV